MKRSGTLSASEASWKVLYWSAKKGVGHSLESLACVNAIQPKALVQDMFICSTLYKDKDKR